MQRTAQIWLIEVFVEMSSFWPPRADFGLPNSSPSTDLAFGSLRDYSFWEHRIIDRPLQECVRFFLGIQEFRVSSRVKSEADYFGEEDLCLPASADSFHCMWRTPGIVQDYSVIASRQVFAVKLTFPQTTVWKAENETGVSLLLSSSQDCTFCASQLIDI